MCVPLELREEHRQLSTRIPERRKELLSKERYSKDNPPPSNCFSDPLVYNMSVERFEAIEKVIATNGFCGHCDAHINHELLKITAMPLCQSCRKLKKVV